jgi:hypothetical protein
LSLFIPQEIFEEAQEATQRLLPEKYKEHSKKNSLNSTSGKNNAK